MPHIPTDLQMDSGMMADLNIRRGTIAMQIMEHIDRAQIERELPHINPLKIH